MKNSSGLSKNIIRLKEITPLLSFVLEDKKCNNCIKYKLKIGSCTGYYLYNDNKIAIQRAFITKGSEFPKHTHKDEKEWLIICNGHIIIEFESGESLNLNEGDFCFVEKGIPHWMIAKEDTWIVGITVPADRGYPNDRNTK